MKLLPTTKVFLTTLVLSTAMVLGCGSESKKAIEGSVSYESEPVNKGTIIFVPTTADLPQAVAEIVDGKYKIPANGGVLPGTYSLRIVAYRSTGRTGNTGPLAGNVDKPILQQYLPAKFNSKTELTVAINEQNQVYDFELTKN